MASKETPTESQLTGLSPRTALWATTMSGHRESAPDLVTAHEGTPLRVGAPLRTRQIREAAEDRALAPGATRALGAGNRLIDEEPDALRTCFERDRDRIVHSSAFRRLAGKTQVFVFPEDHQRTRLTHAIEVAQVARALAEALSLNVALCEAIALGHDCGHGPGGHPSEDAFAKFLPEGFDHAVWGADVVLAPLNLCAETTDAIRNHSWSRPAPSTPEGEIVAWADRIAYVCHDFEDARSAGIVTSADLPQAVAELCGTARSRQISTFVNAIIAATQRSGHVAMATETAAALAAFRQHNYETIYLRPASLEQARRVSVLLDGLVECFAADPSLLPRHEEDFAAQSAEAYRAAVTYVAGMTDRFAFATARRLINWPDDTMPQRIATDNEAD